MSLYAVGITLTNDAGAFVAVHRVQRETGRKREEYSHGWRHSASVWESVARIVGAEPLTGSVPEMVGRIAARLKQEPLVGDVQKRLDISIVGPPVTRLLSERKAYASPVRVEGERPGIDKAGIHTLPVNTLQDVMNVMFSTDRIEVAESLVDGPGLLHSLRGLAALDASGPARDLGIAAALAVWLIHEHPCSRAWASSKPAPHNPEDEWARAAHADALRQARAAARANGKWWEGIDDEW